VGSFIGACRRALSSTIKRPGAGRSQWQRGPLHSLHRPQGRRRCASNHVSWYIRQGCAAVEIGVPLTPWSPSRQSTTRSPQRAPRILWEIPPGASPAVASAAASFQFACCDNCVNAKESIDLTDEFRLLVQAVSFCGGRTGLRKPIDLVRGKDRRGWTRPIKAGFLWQGKQHSEKYWDAVMQLARGVGLVQSVQYCGVSSEMACCLLHWRFRPCTDSSNSPWQTAGPIRLSGLQPLDLVSSEAPTLDSSRSLYRSRFELSNGCGLRLPRVLAVAQFKPAILGREIVKASSHSSGPQDPREKAVYDALLVRRAWHCLLRV